MKGWDLQSGPIRELSTAGQSLQGRAAKPSNGLGFENAGSERKAVNRVRIHGRWYLFRDP